MHQIGGVCAPVIIDLMTLSDELIRERLAHDAASGWRRVRVDDLMGWIRDTQILTKNEPCSAHANTKVVCPRLVVDENRYQTLVDLAHRIRYVDASVWPVTLGEMAKGYLNRCIAASESNRTNLAYTLELDTPTSSLHYLHIPQTLHFDPPAKRTGTWSVIDIDRAYWDLLKRHDADVFFRPEIGHLAVVGGDMPFIRTDEVTRDLGRAIYGRMRRGVNSIYQRGRRSEQHPLTNRYLAADAVGLMMWTMHAIAHEAIRLFGCVHVATDAYIVPRSEGHNLKEWLRSEWGLESGFVASGHGHVWGLNHWRIAGVEKHMGRVNRTDKPGVSNLGRGDWSPRIGPQEVDELRWLASNGP